MTGRPDIDLDAEWAAHRRAERWGFALALAGLAGALLVSLAVVIAALFAVAEAMR
jgi:hypothetical protein